MRELIVSGRKAPRLDLGGGVTPSDRRRIHALSAYRPNEVEYGKDGFQECR